MADAVIFHNQDDIPWHDAPKPWRWHRCKPWTTGRFWPSMQVVERCACGAIRLDYMLWTERNSR